MERQASTKPAQSTDRLPSNQLRVQQEGRKPLFASKPAVRDENKRAQVPVVNGARRLASGASSSNGYDKPQGLGRRMKSEPNVVAPSERRGSNSSIPSPGSTRLPRPSSIATSRRRPMSMTEAFRLAEGEEMEQSDRDPSVNGSPSPAPRPSRSRNGSNDTKLRSILNEDHLDTKSTFRRPPVPLQASANKESDGKDSRTTPLASSTTTSRLQATGRDLARVTGNESPARDGSRDSRFKSRLSGTRPLGAVEMHMDHVNGVGGLPDLVPGIEDVPLPSIESVSPARKGPVHTSPEKSFAWQIDEDFTAGDLQISDSPRIRMSNRPFENRPSILSDIPRIRPIDLGARNTKLGDIRDREALVQNDASIERERPRFNSKLDEIRAREAEVERRIPLHDRFLPRPRNNKLNDIKQREAESLSRRAFAAARLEEIKEQNSMSRSLSPENSRAWSRREPAISEPLSVTGRESRLPVRPRSAFEGGERIPDTPVTVFKSRPQVDMPAEPEPWSKRLTGDAGNARPATSYQRGSDSRDLLRRLARAASSSPAPELDPPKITSPPKPDSKNIDRPTSRFSALGRTSDNEAKTSIRETRENGSSKPNVGFAGLTRTRSTDSTKSKRSSMHSEGDPSDRIASEIKLFAPQDNYSERGSVRAASPLPESDYEDEKAMDATPKPQKLDPLTMPTPRVTGAYVETPATVKVEKLDIAQVGDMKKEEPVSLEMPAIFLDKRKSLAWRQKDQDTASDPGASEKDEAVTTSAALGRKPRARSLPRRRPPLKNSAKPHSVKDDLLELQRAHNLDDSTLDDFEDILTGRKTSSSKLDAILKGLPSRTSSENAEQSSKDSDAEPEPANNSNIKLEKKDDMGSGSDLALYDRMSKSLRTGLLGIRSAKEGIERLEDHFSHAQTKPAESLTTTKELRHQQDHHHKHGGQQDCPICATSSSPRTLAYVHLPIPRLYHFTPRFRFTFLGLILFVFSIWYATETATCAMYCRPTTCSRTPCIWSYDDPTFGTAIPVKLDQWTTGGHGRILANYAFEEAEDWIANMLDLAHGRQITDIAMESLSPEQKRRHRRRLRKKGLIKPLQEPLPEEQVKWNAWRRTREAKERAKELRDLGYESSGYYDDDEGSIGDDERVW